MQLNGFNNISFLLRVEISTLIESFIGGGGVKIYYPINDNSRFYMTIPHWSLFRIIRKISNEYSNIYESMFIIKVISNKMRKRRISMDK